MVPATKVYGRQSYINILFERAPEETKLFLDESTPDIKKRFHCSVCGHFLFEYYTPIRLMIPGETNIVSRNPIIISCHNTLTHYENGRRQNFKCKTKYKIY